MRRALLALAMIAALLLAPWPVLAAAVLSYSLDAISSLEPGGSASLTITLSNTGQVGVDDDFTLGDLADASVVVSGPNRYLIFDPSYKATYRGSATTLSPGNNTSITLGSLSVAADAPDGSYGVQISIDFNGLATATASQAVRTVSVATVEIGDDNALTAYIATLSVNQMGTSFSTPTFTAADIDSGGGRTILEFAERTYWDPARNKILFNGQGHLQTPKQLVYDAEANTWTNGTTDGCNSPGGENHAYNHNAMDPATGRAFYRCYNSKNVRVQDPSDGTWSLYGTVPSAQPQQIGGAIEWFPELGGLIFVDSRLGVWLFNDTTSSWSQLVGGTHDTAATNITMAQYSNFAVYNPTCSCVFLGGGTGTAEGGSSQTMWKLDHTGAISSMASAPVGLGVQQGVLLPNSADNTLMLFHDNGNIYEYDVAGDSWSDTGQNHSVFSTADEWRIGGVIEEYGVFFFILENTTPNFWIYKYTSLTNSFQLACLNQHVIQCIDFDDAGDFTDGCSGGTLYQAGSPECPTVTETLARDTSVKANGASSAKCIVSTGDASDVCGSYTVNFSPGTASDGSSGSYPDQFGEGEEFWVQVKMRYSTGYVTFKITGQGFTGNGSCAPEACGDKLFIVTEGDRPGANNHSCEELEVVPTDNAQRGITQAYHRCGTPINFEVAMGGSDFDLQPPNQCSYQALNGDSTLYDDPPCTPQVEDLWMTYTMQMIIGTWGSGDSTIRVWQQNEGRSTKKLILRRTNFTLHNSDPSNAKYGAIWLTPYNTGKRSDQSHPTFNIWYDDLVISRTLIH